ncbi:MAG: OmpW family protein [Proteobacteria bacterium]|nr:OmpW family protein [Pseudomonadota bacterium]
MQTTAASGTYTLDNTQPPAAAQAQAQAPSQAPSQAQAASSGSDIQDWSKWQIRLRALGVVTDTSSATAYVQNVPSLSTPNSGLSVGNSVVPELDITYYFTRNISAELILGMSQNHITGNGSLNGLDVGSTWLLPPTLTLQYHFTNFGRFQPYIGAGVNYTFFFGQQPAGAYTASGLAITGLHINNSAGFAAQVGFDYMIDKHWGINFDVKKLILRPTYNAWVNYTIPVSGTAALDPWLFGGGVTYRF